MAGGVGDGDNLYDVLVNPVDDKIGADRPKQEGTALGQIGSRMADAWERREVIELRIHRFEPLVRRSEIVGRDVLPVPTRSSRTPGPNR